MAQCRDCRAEFTWARTSGRGSFIKLDPYPDDRAGTVHKLTRTDEHGNTHLVTDENSVVFAEILTGESLHRAIANGDKLYVLHNHTCHARRPANPMPDHVRAALPPRRHRRFRP